MASFKDKPFSVKREQHCLALALKVAKGLGVKVPNATKFKGYRSIEEAQALTEKLWGIRSMREFCDKFFQRIPPASALPGDFMELPAIDDANGVGSLGVAIGNGAVFLYDEGHSLPVAGHLSYEDGKAPLAAWRTLK